MPFVSEKQRRACFAIMKRYNEKGLVAPWDCHEFAKKSSSKKSTKKSSTKRSTKKSSSKKSTKKSTQKIHKGPRGGKYKIIRNKKVYV